MPTDVIIHYYIPKKGGRKKVTGKKSHGKKSQETKSQEKSHNYKDQEKIHISVHKCSST